MNKDLQNIVSNVRVLYQKYGIKSITMDDVARELGISKKTLYQHIKDKTELVEKVSSNQSIAGKTILINEDNHEVFSKGHRSIQGLFYDKNNQVIFSSEHGPTGGDEINIISRGENYGWPYATYGTNYNSYNAYTEDLSKDKNKDVRT